MAEDGPLFPPDVFRHQVDVSCDGEVDRGLNQTAVRAEERNDEPVQLDVVAHDVGVIFGVEQIVWQRLDVDDPIEPNQVQSRAFGWNDGAKQDSLMVQGTNVVPAADHPQVPMDVV